jgi:hypothetical protein
METVIPAGVEGTVRLEQHDIAYFPVPDSDMIKHDTALLATPELTERQNSITFNDDRNNLRRGVLFAQTQFTSITSFPQTVT